MPNQPPTADEADVMRNLSRAGKRLIGFCRTNLFKRLESSGYAFLLSVRRHILRNFIFLHAIDNGLPLPVGTQDSALFDTRSEDSDNESNLLELEPAHKAHPDAIHAKSLDDFALAAAHAYKTIEAEHLSMFDWLRPDLFVEELAKHLRQDVERLFTILDIAGEWDPSRDRKL